MWASARVAAGFAPGRMEQCACQHVGDAGGSVRRLGRAMALVALTGALLAGLVGPAQAAPPPPPPPNPTDGQLDASRSAVTQRTTQVAGLTSRLSALDDQAAAIALELSARQEQANRALVDQQNAKAAADEASRAAAAARQADHRRVGRCRRAAHAGRRVRDRPLPAGPRHRPARPAHRAGRAAGRAGPVGVRRPHRRAAAAGPRQPAARARGQGERRLVGPEG